VLQALRDVQWDLSLNDYTEVAFPLDLLILDLAILRMLGAIRVPYFKEYSTATGSLIQQQLFQSSA
jgi:hypothetical protein